MGRRQVSPRRTKISICKACNSDFGEQLEAPVSAIFDALEHNSGLNDGEADLLIRWLWKFHGLSWKMNHPEAVYSTIGSLRERVLHPIRKLRSDIILAVGLVAMIDPSYGDAPMGIDSNCEYSSLFVSGVFGRLALMLVLRNFADIIPPQFSRFALAPTPVPPGADAKVLIPPTRFRTCSEAVTVTLRASIALEAAHDEWAQACLASAGPDYGGGV